ncbi:MAG: lipoprotein-releasing system transmembrane subunit LolC [Thiotrichales bacterium]|nr:MAG: lipoprotein-releasing system transmembrane subunit LolC [Thiotrichales bacterium]
MTKPLPLFIAWRYTRAKSRNGFISFISLASMLGIALGVTVLITALSVMNGFHKELSTRVMSLLPHITINSMSRSIHNWQTLKTKLHANKHILQSAPFVQGEALLRHNQSTAFVVVRGIEPKLERNITPIAKKMVTGKLDDLISGKFGVILGQDLADNLGVEVGNKVVVITPNINFSIAGIAPRLKRFTVVGTFRVKYQYDSTFALINLKDAQKLFSLNNAITGLQLKLSDMWQAPSVARQLNQTLPFGYHAYDWSLQNPNFFKALKMEKMIMFLMLTLVIAIAAFNLLSSQVMLVMDKRKDIAILRTIGMKTGTIVRIFILQGLIVGFIGTLIGTVCGLLLSFKITDLTNYLQKLLHVQFLSTDVYYVTFIPSHIQIMDVVGVCSIGMLLCFLATIYPAWRASKIHPVRVLRYE